jgi:hypothetical protein
MPTAGGKRGRHEFPVEGPWLGARSRSSKPKTFYSGVYACSDPPSVRLHPDVVPAKTTPCEFVDQGIAIPNFLAGALELSADAASLLAAGRVLCSAIKGLSELTQNPGTSRQVCKGPI